MRLFSPLLRAVCVVALGGLGGLSPVTAQGPPPTRLIGLTQAGPTGLTLLFRQEACASPVPVCTGSPGTIRDPAGGLAFDAGRAAVWHTDGAVIRLTSADGCRSDCAFPARTRLPGGVASGLTFREQGRVLTWLETTAGFAVLHRLDASTCPPAPLGSCSFRLPSPRHAAGAVTQSALHDLVFVATSIFSNQVANPNNVVLVARRSDPCTAVCTFPVPNCGRMSLGPIRAMAFDDCAGTLIVSDGQQTAILAGVAGACAYRETSCCSNPPRTGRWVGLDVESRSPEPVGASCGAAGCPPCRRLVLGPRGAPAIGNPDFGVAIDGGPAGGLGLLLLNLGRCRATTLPGLCGPIQPMLGPLPPILLPLGGLRGSGCDATASLGLPVPLDPALCDATLCLQGAVVCPNGGLMLTNGLLVPIGA